MFRPLHNWSIKTKTMLILLVSVISFTVAGETIVVPLMLGHLMNERQVGAQQVVEVACGILKRHEQMVSKGQESSDEAKGNAISLLKSLRFRGQEYFWIHDLSRPVPKMIMHPIVPSLDGKVLDDPQFNKASGKRALSDPAMVKLGNKNLFVTMNEVAESAGE